MATNARKEITQLRSQMADETEPLGVKEVDVQHNGSSFRQTIPSEAAMIMNIDDSTVLAVEIYDDGYWVEVR